MVTPKNTLITHISLFLDYCQEIGLSNNTQKNYKMYLNKFIFWLKEIKKNNILPHELTIDDINSYKSYLSQFSGPKDQRLKKVTQNYYLIALRALLRYFEDKRISALPFSQIRLPGGFKHEKIVNFLNSNQVEALLLAPDTKTLKGIRDRAILETITATGLKIRWLTSLNKDQIDVIPGEILPRIKEYLQTRKDKDNALFINYRARKKSTGGRLTPRSIERIVNYYGRKINLPFLITPEILRWARAHAILNKEIEIQEPKNHKAFQIESYDNKEPIRTPLLGQESKNNQSPIWHIVENIINKEFDWLKDNIETMPESYKENPPFLKYDDSILRKIAILIVSGKIKATEFKRKDENKDLWNNLTEKENINRINRHGQEWHRKMMDVIYEYFKSRSYKVFLEPVLNYGRADLEVYSNKNNIIYIEVGTVSLFKLWYNLSTMKNATFLIVPEENYVIEFKT